MELEVAGERASYRRFAMNDDSAVFHGAGALEDLAYGGRDSREQMGDGSGQNQKPKTKNGKRKTFSVSGTPPVCWWYNSAMMKTIVCQDRLGTNHQQEHGRF